MEMLLLTITIASVLTAVVMSAAVWKWARASREHTAVRVEALRALAFEDGTPPMFVSSAERGTPRGRWIAVAVVAVTMASIVGTGVALHEERPAGASHADAAPLDLLTLRQTTDARGKFIVSGQVRNSTTGKSLQGVAAFVDLFDQHGELVAASTAALAVPVLQTGDESSFVVALPKTAGVVRYRVRFRRGDGIAVPHVDRRAPSAAQAVERTGHERLE
jgi:hypothetical protein